jgi:predicted amidohydrolase YtcJ
MKQAKIKNMMKKMLSNVALASSVVSTCMLAGCKDDKNNSNTVNNSADLVVYGKIFTAENNQMAEALAVKDGKYVYVGDKKGAEAYILAGKTEVVDYSGKGLVMPGCGNGHSHYMLGYAHKSIGTIFDLQDDTELFLKKIKEAVKKARAEGATSIFGQGWRLQSLEANMPTRQDLDDICSDISIYMLD